MASTVPVGGEAGAAGAAEAAELIEREVAAAAAIQRTAGGASHQVAARAPARAAEVARATRRAAASTAADALADDVQQRAVAVQLQAETTAVRVAHAARSAAQIVASSGPSGGEAQAALVADQGSAAVAAAAVAQQFPSCPIGTPPGPPQPAWAPGVSRLRTSSIATSASLLLLSCETRFKNVKACSGLSP